MSKAEQKVSWPPTSPDKAIEELGLLIPKPGGVPEHTYGHALSILADLNRSLSAQVDPNVINQMVKRVREDIERGKLPVDTLDLIGYEEEPENWRE